MTAVEGQAYNLQLESTACNMMNAKETNLNGHIVNGVQTKEGITISVTNMKVEVRNGNTCAMCGQSLESQTRIISPDKTSLKLVCKNCPKSEHPVFDEDADSSSKRDSGFHTMRRDEKMKGEPENLDPGMSSASSADSAVSVEFSDPGRTESASDIPAIVVDPTELENLRPNSLNDSKPEINPNKLDPKGKGYLETPKSLANKLFKYDGFSRMDIASHICKNNDFSEKVGREYLKHFNFAEVFLLDAYRDFLSNFALVGETQERERILLFFSERYVDCNPNFLDGKADSVFFLVCALTLLNTDRSLGGRKKMTSKEFVNLFNNKSSEEGYSKDLLVSLYTSIKKNPLPWGGKEQRKLPRSSSMRENPEIDGPVSSSKMVNRSQSVRSPVKTINQTSASGTRGAGRTAKMKSLSSNQGLLWRKVLLDSDGKKVSLGKRGWKVYTVTLKNLEMHVVKRGTTEAKCISLHHSWAEESANDSKRQNVFRLTLADTSVTLYQASSEKEAKKWIQDINKAAALLSAAPLCSPVGSQMVFRKPLLPSAASTLPLVNQYDKMKELLQENEEDMKTTKNEFDKEKSHQHVQYYNDKMEYLNLELKKYQNYVKILQELLKSSSDFAKDDQDVPITNLEASHGSSESGSLVSMTPSEPPMASPAFHTNDTFAYPDMGGSPAHVYPPGGLASPALMSPQQRNLALSPTSSLPNLSPILEGSPIHAGAFANDGSYGSLRRRPRMNANSMHPSTAKLKASCNSEESSQENTNSNNSNHVLSKLPPHLSQKPGTRLPPTPSLQIHEKAVPREDFIPSPFERHVTDHRVGHSMEETSSSDRHAYPGLFETSMGSLPRRRKKKYTLDTTSCSHVASEAIIRVRGRNERKGTDRYSYLQAVSSDT